MNSLYRLSDATSNITGEHYTRDFPRIPIFPPRLSFPSVNTGAGGGGGSITDTQLFQIKDDVSLQAGTHALKLGANFNYLNDIGLLNGNEHFATLTFFDDPSVILSNSNGRYPQGCRRPASCGSGSRPTRFWRTRSLTHSRSWRGSRTTGGRRSV
jgi:hypothetical protein